MSKQFIGLSFVNNPELYDQVMDKRNKDGLEMLGESTYIKYLLQKAIENE